MQWLSYFFLAFAISLAINFFVIGFKKSSDAFKRFGGLGIIVSFVLVLIFNPEIEFTLEIKALILGSALILFFGLMDDLKDFSWKKQLWFQIGLAIVLIIFGYQVEYITNPFGGLIRFDSAGDAFLLFFSGMFIIGWVVGIINSVNWSDGIDGLAAGIGILSSIAIFFISLREDVKQPAVAIVSLIFSGSLLGFWWYNFPRAKIEAGTSGSYFIGFIVATLAIIAGTKIAAALVVLMPAILDALWVIIERHRERKPVTEREPNNRHLHYRLRRAGWSDRKILLSYMIFLSLVLVGSLITPSRKHKAILLMGESAVIMGMLVYAKKNEDKEVVTIGN